MIKNFRYLISIFRLMATHSSNLDETEELNMINRLKRRVTFIKYKSNCHTYSRIYYLSLSEDSINYQGSRHKSKHEACINIEILLINKYLY